MYFFSPRFSTFEKPNSELYFVHTEKGETPVPVRLKRSEIRNKPLRSELNLLTKSGIKGFPPRKRKVQGKAGIHDPPEAPVDSSSDEECTRSVSYQSITSSRVGKILSHKEEYLGKEKGNPRIKDLWEEGKYGT